ncbi:M48 family metallopeptidase [Pararhodonellum marinum]|uniref:M48 family metallopeptidase n=1 Tax=Pararhodonellum marinum TaxID=2755358 RepID=UPI00188FF3AB|nr:M48 family metallopeptidase [Pararhodonellum marinum]
MTKKLIALFFIGLMAYSCAKVPLSGRRQLNLMPNSEILPMAYQQYGEVLAESKVVTNSPEGQKVVRVGQNMANAVETYLKEIGYTEILEGFAWEFNLIESDQVNAWCMPGGKVAFYTGILPICEDEAGIAVVMGHEIAHAVASHGRERMSNQMAINGLLGGVQVAMGQDPNLTQAIFMQAIGAGGQLGMLQFSRNHELEADRLGLIFMSIAGYDPREAPGFWERMSAGAGQSPPEFLSTHPGPGRRIEELNKQMPEALEYYNKNK